LTCRIASFHEYQDWDSSPDLVVNYNTFDGFSEVSAPHILAGPTYCILNPAILSQVGSATSEEVLVNFGGADPSRFSESFIEQVAPYVPSIPFVLHLGPLSHKSLTDLPANVRLSHPSESFFKLMASCRAAVTAAGNSMYELICLEKPALVVAHNPHQAEFAATAARMGAVHYFGSAPKVNWVALASSLLECPAPPRLKPPLIDGLGLNRIVARINQLAA
jgi:spore coat polysaccharide biosynthesis predicted glycosyltransferase SpsG